MPPWDQFLGTCNYINLCRAHLLINLDPSWAEAFSYSIQGRKCDNINRGIGSELDQAIMYTRERYMDGLEVHSAAGRCPFLQLAICNSRTFIHLHVALNNATRHRPGERLDLRILVASDVPRGPTIKQK